MFATIMLIAAILLIVSGYLSVKHQRTTTAAPQGLALLTYNLSDWLRANSPQWKRWVFFYAGTPLFMAFHYNIFWWAVFLILWYWAVAKIRQVAQLRDSGVAE